jgi:L-cysteine S-thiosulfotransferase
MRRLAAIAASLALSGGALAQGLLEPLTEMPGDPQRGRAIVVDRQVGLCLLCHSGPFPDVPFQGDLAPDLAGVGARLDRAELRQRMVDSRALNPDTIMPPYHSLEGLHRVGDRWQGRTILDAQAIEDVVAFLATLTEDPG